MNFMDDALKEAEKALREEEIPVGAVIVKDGVIIGHGYNKKEGKKDPTMHAEILAIKEACKTLGDWRLSECEMYVTLEPCPMCTGAILQSRIKELHIGTFNKDMGACGTVVNLPGCAKLNNFLRVIWEYDTRCSEILKLFFRKKRKSQEDFDM